MASETKNGLPDRLSAPQKRPQELKTQKDSNPIDCEDANGSVGAELFSDPPSRRRNELRPCDRHIYKRDRGDAHSRLTNSTDRFVCTFCGQTNRALLNDFCRTHPNTNRLCNRTDSACDNGDIECGKTNLFPSRQSLAANQDCFNVSDTAEEQ